MIALYIVCLLPFFLWIAAWFIFQKVNILEVLIPSCVTFIVAALVHLISFKSQTGDKEYWSGQITQVKQFSEWREYYEEAIYRTEYYYENESYSVTDNKGRSHKKTRRVKKSRRVFDHWEPRTRWHERHNTAYSNIGTEYSISDAEYKEWAQNFGGDSQVKGDRTTFSHNSRMIGGKDYDLTASNKTGFVIPVTKQVSFENRIKAKTSIWSHAKPPKDLNLPNRPENSNPFSSSRLCGTANKYFSIRALDNLNAVLGPVKQIDLVIVGFDSDDAQLSNYLEAKWDGGTKNQLVITFGDKWVRVFGWSKSDFCKANIESLFLKYKKDDNLLKLVEAEIRNNYERRNWHDFDHLSVEPGGWAWFWFLLVSTILHGGAFWFAYNNTDDKNEVDSSIIKWFSDKYQSIATWCRALTSRN